MGGVQAALIIGVGKAKDRHVEWPAILMAVASAVLLAAGILRHYIDVYVHRTVRGISFIFVGIDALGDVFSLISVMFQPTLDVLGMVIYGTELVLWIGIFVCGGYYNLVPWLKRKHSGQVDEDSPAAPREDQGQYYAAAVHGIALHDLPSSTSVFRTPSGEFAALRRTVNRGASSEGVQRAR